MSVYYRLPENKMTTPYTTHQVFSASQRKRYMTEMKDTLAECLRLFAAPPVESERKGHDVIPLRRHIRKWFARGAPIDPQGAGAPTPTLRIVIRQMAIQVTGLAEYHADCRLWLRYPECRARTDAEREKTRRDLARVQNVKPMSENWIPWNLFLYATRDTPYYALNKKGFEVTVGQDPKLAKEE